jgi:hypothetical protein
MIFYYIEIDKEKLCQRRLLLNASASWKKKKLFTLLKHVLDDKYLKTASRESEDYRKFSDDTFGNILSLLYKENSNAYTG